MRVGASICCGGICSFFSCLAVHLRDIMFADGGNNDVSEDGTKVNVFKIRSLGRCIYHLLKYARIPYDLPRNAQVGRTLIMCNTHTHARRCAKAASIVGNPKS